MLLVVVPAFMAMCAWQVTRALGGNELSWAYVFEWPLFAAYAIYMWWRLLHESSPATSPPLQGRTVPGGQDEDRSDAVSTVGAALAHEGQPEEDAALAVYNAYLAKLAEHDRAAGH